MSSQLIEISKLNSIIQEAEEERQRQKKELNAVVGERDILTRYVHSDLFVLFVVRWCGGGGRGGALEVVLLLWGTDQTRHQTGWDHLV